MTKKTRAKVRRALLSLSLVLVMMMAAVGGTIAWLTDSTQSVVNVFNGTKVDITLEETTGEEYDIVPGVDIPKDPTVTVYPGSEACYVFVKIEKANDFDDYCSFEIADGWTEVTAGSGVYYREQAAIADNGQAVAHQIIENNTVYVSSELTQEEMKALFEEGVQMPKLTFTAYAIQKAETGSAAEAWGFVQAAKDKDTQYYTKTVVSD